MLFGDKKQIIFLKRNSLILYDQSAKNIVSCTFPENVVHNLEVENPTQFELIVAKFLVDTKITKAEVFLVLSDELIFHKSYPVNTPENQISIQNFLNTIPFEPTELSYIHYLTKEWLIYLAINQAIIESLKNSLQKSGWIVKAVLPGFLFGNINPDGSLTPQTIIQINKSEKLVKEYNFLNSL